MKKEKELVGEKLVPEIQIIIAAGIQVKKKRKRKKETYKRQIGNDFSLAEGSSNEKSVRAVHTG